MTTFLSAYDNRLQGFYNNFWEKNEFCSLNGELMTTAAPLAVGSFQPRFTSSSASLIRDMASGSGIQSAQAQASSGACEACYRRSMDLQRSAMRLMMIENQKMMRLSGIPTLETLLKAVYDQLHLPDQLMAGTSRGGHCDHCGMHVEFLKKHALLVLQSASFAPFLTQSMIPSNVLVAGTPASRAAMTQAEPTAYACTKKPATDNHRDGRALEGNTSSSVSPTAAMFFAKAAEKFNIQKKKSKRSSSRNQASGEDPIFPTNFSALIQLNPPANPPGLFRYMGRRVDGKVSVMLRLCQPSGTDQVGGLIDVDQRRKQITIMPPKNADHMTPKAQAALLNSSPKMFAFDAIFEPDLPQSRIAAASVLDVLHAVINGGDGCVLVYGAADLGKTCTMVGRDDSSNSAGIIPSAIAWLYSLIEDSKQRTGARFAVRVSAVEVVGKAETLKDLLTEQSSGASSASDNGTSPGIYLREDLIGGVQLSNVKELRAATAEKAAFYLDAALDARGKRSFSGNDSATEACQASHMLFTLHVYQYRLDKNGRSQGMCSGGRSRLHLIDLTCPETSRITSDSAPGLVALGSIIVALLNGMKKVPYKDSKITQLLKDSIGNPTCRTTLVAHASTNETSFSKTMQTILTVSKIQRSRRKRNKYASSSSDQGSCDEVRSGRPHPAMLKTSGIDDGCGVPSDYNTSSAGEDSCDTVIYMGSNGNTSDSNLTDNERPPSPKTFAAMKMKIQVSASSSDDDVFDSCPIDRPTDQIIERCKRLDDMVDASIDATPEEVLCYLSDTSPLNSLRGKCRAAPDYLESSVDPENLGTSVDLLGSRESYEKGLFPSPASLDPSEDLAEHKLGAPLDVKLVGSASLPSFKDKTVNVVAPLVIKEKACSGSPGIPPSLEASLAEGIEESSKAGKLLLIPYGSDEDLTCDVPSEKELRKCEKRIAKLLKHTMDDEETVRAHSRLSLTPTKPHKSADSKLPLSARVVDGYISAPEGGVFIKRANVPVQAVKGVVRQQSVEAAADGIGASPTAVAAVKEIMQPIATGDDSKNAGALVENEGVAGNDLDASGNNLGGTSASACREAKTADVGVVSLVTEGLATLSSSSPIKSLDHIITVTRVPNFKVAPRPKLTTFGSASCTDSIPSPLSSRVVRLTCAGKDSASNLACDSTPRLERSYSREDTVSLASVNESDAYDSDAYSSSYSVSPAADRRNRVGPTRLKYRWSTVYEEDEKDVKKEARGDHKITKRRDKKDRSDRGLSAEKTDDEDVIIRLNGSPRSKRNLISPAKILSSPKSDKKFSQKSPQLLRSPKKGGKHDLKVVDKRISVCSDASSGIGSSHSSQTPSLHSGDEPQESAKDQKCLTPMPRRWFFGRIKSKKTSGYMSDGNFTDSARSVRRSRFFGSRSKSSLTDGHSSGYETVTECGANSCAEETDCESVAGKKKKRRFLGFRRRSTSDLNKSRGRVRRFNWFHSSGAMSEDEVRIKVYHIDVPNDSHKNRKGLLPNFSAAKSTPTLIELHRQRIEELKQKRSDLVGAGSECAYQAVQSDRFAYDLQADVRKYEQRTAVLSIHPQLATCVEDIEHKVTQI